MADFAEIESRDGVRMTWNVWPGTKTEANTLSTIPLAISYTPLHSWAQNNNGNDRRGVSVLPYSPLRCKSCRSFLNPFCSVDFISNLWVCPFCFQRNHFPDSYSAIVSSRSLPYELCSDSTTVEYSVESSLGEKYRTTSSSTSSPVFLFLVDTCVAEEELRFLKSSLTQAIDMITSSYLVGLITFGTMVHIHELGFTEIPKSYAFKSSGDGKISKDQIIESLGLFDGSYIASKKHVGVVAGVHDGVSAKSISRFLVPASECEISFNSVSLFPLIHGNMIYLFHLIHVFRLF